MGTLPHLIEKTNPRLAVWPIGAQTSVRSAAFGAGLVCDHAGVATRIMHRTSFFIFFALKSGPRSLNRIGGPKSTCRIFGQTTANQKRWRIILIDATKYLGIWPRLTDEARGNRLANIRH